MLLRRIPANTAVHVTAPWADAPRTMPAAIKNLYAEHRSFTLYMAAHEAYGEWFAHQQRRPHAPATQQPIDDTSAYLMRQHQVALNQWRERDADLARQAIRAIHAVLEQPHGAPASALATPHACGGDTAAPLCRLDGGGRAGRQRSHARRAV